MNHENYYAFGEKTKDYELRRFGNPAGTAHMIHTSAALSAVFAATPALLHLNLVPMMAAFWVPIGMNLTAKFSY